MKHLIRTAAAVFGLALIPSAVATELRSVQISATGFDCASCFRAVTAAIKKLEGVESIELSVEKSSADIRLKADEPKDAIITGRGRIVDREGRPALDLLNGSFLDLAEKPKDAPTVAVEFTGVSRLGEKHTEQLTISSIKK